MTGFISLSSTSKIFGMLISASPGSSGSRGLLGWLTICGYITKGGRIAVRDSGRSCDPVLFYKDCQTVTLDRLDKIIGGAQVQSPGLVIHDGDHDHRYLRQVRVILQPIQNSPPIAFKHDNVRGDKQRAKLLGEAEAFFSVRGGNSPEIQFRQEARHQVANGRVVVYYQNRIQVCFRLWQCARNVARSLRRCGFNCLDNDMGRQLHRKGGALPGLALDADFSFHQLDETVCNGESKTGPTVLAGNRRIRLGELLEQVLLLLCGDANAFVADLELNPVFPLYLDLIRVRGDGAMIRKLGGVTEQVEQDLPDFRNIRAHHAYVLLQMQAT